jgi:predicted MFS family arabinose efflux permease
LGIDARRRHIGTGLALNSTQFNISRILGPALAGIIIANVGAIGCFIVSAASYLPFIAVALLVLPPGRAPRSSDDHFDLRHPYAGIGEIIRTPHLRDALLTTFFSGLLCGPLLVFCPVLVKQSFNGDAGQFSLGVSAFGIGGLMGALGLLAISGGVDRRRLSGWFAAGFGVTVVSAALTPWFWSFVAILILAGVAMSVTNTSTNTVIQTAASSQLRGQAVSLYMLAVRGSGAMGSLVTGFSISLLGVRQALLINGLLAILAQLLVGRHWRKIPLPGSTDTRPPVDRPRRIAR